MSLRQHRFTWALSQGTPWCPQTKYRIGDKSHHLRLDEWTRQAIGEVPSGSEMEDVLPSSAGHSWPSGEGE